MSTSKHLDLICLLGALLAIVLTVVFLCAEALGVRPVRRVMGYEETLFAADRVHTIDIVMDDWEEFIATCEDEEYAACSVVIDGEAYKNVAIRAKGNTSLSTVARMDSDRYSFKIEFDHYESGSTYHGLDKLSLNNLIQDNTMMKDYLTYRMMGEFGAAAPLVSYAYITVNGEDWGLYLAAEGVEDSFLQRNYGADTGELYKPDAMDMGGGRGNGRDFDMERFREEMGEESEQRMPQFSQRPQTEGAMPPEDFAQMPQTDGEMQFPGGERQRPDGRMPQQGGRGGMGANDVKLQYIDDNAESYENIFSSAKTDVSEADKQRLIAALKTLSEQQDVEAALDVEAVLRYFVVHNFVVNGDSYTGNMIHNYYLHEKDGRLSMLPWDYNLAYGTFHGGEASSAVNDPVDEVLSDRPMQSWIFSKEEYTARYHALFAAFLEQVDAQTIIDEAYALIAPYVEKDPSKFCTYEEFTRGIAALKTFCALRTESVRGQLDGTIPSTAEAQNGSDALVDASALTISEMGTMDMGGGQRGEMPQFGERAPRGEMPFEQRQQKRGQQG